MNPSVFADMVAYYAERYEQVVRLPFVAPRKVFLRDHEDEASRLCRFCNRGKPIVSFHDDAHAAPESVGNMSILSLNECDGCNTYLADNYEDHLAKWSLFARATSLIKGKKRKGKKREPTFKNPDETLRIVTGMGGLEITLTNADLTSDLMAEGGPYEFKLPVDASSQPHVPIRAAMALVKVACSICPSEHLDQCRPAIDWLMQRASVSMSGLPILHTFTPGPISDEASEVVLLRRKVDERIPLLWCVLQFSNHRLQTFVPFCPADAEWLRMGEAVSFTCKHFPSRFGPDWPYGETEYGSLDWSETESVQRTATATFHVERAVRIR